MLCGEAVGHLCCAVVGEGASMRDLFSSVAGCIQAHNTVGGGVGAWCIGGIHVACSLEAHDPYWCGLWVMIPLLVWSVRHMIPSHLEVGQPHCRVLECFLLSHENDSVVCEGVGKCLCGSVGVGRTEWQGRWALRVIMWLVMQFFKSTYRRKLSVLLSSCM